MMDAAMLERRREATTVGDDAGLFRATTSEGGNKQHESTEQWTSWPRAAVRNDVAFWFLGLINNTSYVIMMAFAKDILPSAVGIVFLADVAPTMLVKVSAPYWFHRVSYSTRVLASSLLMVLSFVTVGYFYPVTWIQLIGVSFSAFQGGLGEASFLALASFYDTPRALTAWSSGTGFAGIFGYAWVFFFRFALGLSLRATLMMACLLALAWLLTFFVLLTDPLDSGYGDSSDISTTTKGLEYSPLPSLRSPVSPTFTNGTISEGRIFVGRHRNGDRGECRESWGGELYLDAPPNSVQTLPSLDVAQGKLEGKQRAVTMTARERMYFTLSLWRFMVPLTLVYFAEYTMQTGTWSAIGFPVKSPEARRRFYEYANWSYQGGVFVSRSSGLVIRLSVLSLWALPTIQLFMLLFFYLVAVERFWNNYGLLFLCFGVGLVGGLGYVNSFRLVAEAVRPELKELALASASVGDSLGVMTSDIAGTFLQKYLYKRNMISD